MKHRTFRLTGLLLALCLLAGCGGQKEPPPFADPAEAPAAAGKTEDPGEEIPEALSLKTLAGVWQQYSTEVEGDYQLSAESGWREYLIFDSAGTVTREAFPWPGERQEAADLPVTQDDSGAFRFRYEDDFSPVDCTVVSLENGELTVSTEFFYDETIPAGATHIYRRLQPDEDGFAGRPLTAAELETVAATIDADDNGFFVCTYARPEEIDWHQVCYNGAGIGMPVTGEVLAAYERAAGYPPETDLELISREALERLAQEKTGVSYAAARRPLQDRWRYLSEFDAWAFQHGDTNWMSLQLLEGFVDGDVYKLCYMGYDREWYADSCIMVMTARRTPDGWQYYSNLPWSDTPAVTLADIALYETLEEAATAREYREATELAPLPSDEPAWYWAVVTSRRDGLRLAVDRRYDGPEDAFLVVNGVYVPSDRLYDTVLDRGESVALRVNLAWYPSFRLAAQWEDYYGQMWMGEDNGRRLWDAAGRPLDRYIVGHNDAAENRSPDYADEAQLAAFLQGEWLYKDPDSGEATAVFTFHDYRFLTVITREEMYEICLDFDPLYSEEGVQYILQWEKYYYNDEMWEPYGHFSSKALGDYLVQAEQQSGVQVLTLSQANNGDGILTDLLPGETPSRTFRLLRFTGSLTD